MIDRIPGVDYRFDDPGLLTKALTHRSAGQRNYERLEFLGDSVLDLVVTERLLQRYPDAPEGDLSRMRARLVRGDSLKDLAAQIELDRHLLLGESERKSGAKLRASILADALEALLGAVFLDGGYPACRKVILDLWGPLIDSLPDVEKLKDAKTRLQEYLQGRGRPLPLYELLREAGADHAKEFHVVCRLQDADIAVEASARSLRKAEQLAAADMLEALAAA